MMSLKRPREADNGAKTLPMDARMPLSVIISAPTHENISSLPRIQRPKFSAGDRSLSNSSRASSVASTSMTSSGSLFNEKPTLTHLTPSTATASAPPTSPTQTPSPQPSVLPSRTNESGMKTVSNESARKPPQITSDATRPIQAKAKAPLRPVKIELAQKVAKARPKRPPRKAKETPATEHWVDEYALASDMETVILSPRGSAKKLKAMKQRSVKKEKETRRRNELNDPCNSTGCKEVGERYIEENDEVGEPGWRCWSHIPGPPCSALGCTEYGRPRKNGTDGPVYCRTHQIQCVVFNCTHIGRLKIPADELGAAGWRCKKHGGGHKCNVPGCLDSGQVKASVDDCLGPAGYRCDVHGRKCSVIACMNMGLLQRPADLQGPAGRRCTRHGGAEKCNVIGCRSNAKLKLKRPDANGAAGPRCDRHSKMCTARGCSKIGQRRCKEDFHGPEGYRCLRHGGGHECNVEHCNCIGQVKKKEPDHLGPAGYRCNQHGQFCVVPNCCRGGRRKCPADELGPAGYRCRMHLQD